jgi:hypothetical protein
MGVVTDIRASRQDDHDSRDCPSISAAPTTASHQQHYFRPLDCPSDNTAAKMGKNEQQQPSKQHLPIATAPTAKSSATAENN